MELIVKKNRKDQVDYLWSLSLFGEFKGIKLNYKTFRNPVGDANGSLDAFYPIDAINKIMRLTWDNEGKVGLQEHQVNHKRPSGMFVGTQQ